MIFALRTRSRAAVARDLVLADFVLALLLTAVAAAPGTSGVWVELGELPVRPLDALGIVLVLGQSLPLVLRRVRPEVCLALIGVAFAVHQVLGYPPTAAGLGLYLALYAAGSHLRDHRRATAAPAVAGYLVLAATLRAVGSPAGVVELLTFLPVLAAFWIAGAWVRSRRGTQASLRAADAAAAVAEERARIARELHDVVSHHVTAMVVQAEAMGFLVEREPERVVAGLEVIAETGRSAMSDLRDLLGALHAPTGPGGETDSKPGRGHDREPGRGLDREPGPEPGREPAVGRLSDLTARARAAGLVVGLHESGPAITGSAGVDLAVYRVVQESLTNAVKHAPGAGVDVRVDRGPREVVVAVVTGSSPRVGRPPRSWARSGHGLVGLQERVGFVGGRFAAGPEPGGGFAVRAWIPVGAGHD